MQYDIFLSYSAEEERLAEKITAYLEHYNFNCFFAQRDLPAGIPWSQGIAEGIEQSRMSIVVYTDNYNNASWLDDELAEIGRSEKPMLVYALTNANYCEAKNEYMKNAPCIGAVGNIYDAFPYIYETVCNILGQPIEPTQSAEEVLKELFQQEEAQKVETAQTEQVKQVADASAVSNKKQNNDSGSDVATPVKASANKGASLLTAALIGVSITAAMILLLEWLLE